MLGDGSIACAVRTKDAHLDQTRLLVLILEKCAVLADLPSERSFAAEVFPGALLMSLGIANPLGGSLALELGDRSEDRQHELGDVVARNITAKIEEP